MGSFVVQKTGTKINPGWRVISKPLLTRLVQTKRSISKGVTKDADAELLKKKLKKVENNLNKLGQQLFQDTYGPDKKKLLDYPGPRESFADLSGFLEYGITYMLNSYCCKVQPRKGDYLIGIGQYKRALAIYFLIEFKEEQAAIEFANVSKTCSDPFTDFKFRAPRGSLRITSKLEDKAAARAMYLILREKYDESGIKTLPEAESRALSAVCRMAIKDSREKVSKFLQDFNK